MLLTVYSTLPGPTLAEPLWSGSERPRTRADSESTATDAA